MHANRLLDSDKPGHTETAKKLMIVIEMTGAHSEFRLDQFCVQMITAATFITCLSLKKLGKINAFFSNSA